MNAVVGVRIPSPEEMGAALRDFAGLLLAGASLAPRDVDFDRLLDLYSQYLAAIDHRFESGAAAMLELPKGDASDSYAFTLVYEELVYVVRHYGGPQARDLERTRLPKLADDAEVVKGSIEAIFERLPKWVQKLLDIGMEILRLASGRVGE